MRTPWGTPRAVRAEQEANDETPASKWCPRCKLDKPASEFIPLKSGQLYAYCRACENAYKRERRKSNPEKPGARRGEHLFRAYGITKAEYDALLVAQWGLCAICGKGERTLGGRNGTTPKVLAVDHDRSTGKVRGLLCERCNRGIGCFNHDPQLFLAAMAYLNKQDKET